MDVVSTFMERNTSAASSLVIPTPLSADDAEIIFSLSFFLVRARVASQGCRAQGCQAHDDGDEQGIPHSLDRFCRYSLSLSLSRRSSAPLATRVIARLSDKRTRRRRRRRRRRRGESAAAAWRNDGGRRRRRPAAAWAQFSKNRQEVGGPLGGQVSADPRLFDFELDTLGSSFLKLDIRSWRSQLE